LARVRYAALPAPTVHLVTVPHQTVVELKYLKLWLNSFRDRQISHELATAEIAGALADQLDLHYAFVLMEYTPRGNLTTIPMVEYRHPRLAALAPTTRFGWPSTTRRSPNAYSSSACWPRN
jgi:7-cyano-7-deazaguanine reductase